MTLQKAARMRYPRERRKFLARLFGYTVSVLDHSPGPWAYFEHFCFSRAEALDWMRCYGRDCLIHVERFQGTKLATIVAERRT